MNLNALKRTENYTLTTISRVSVGLEAGVKRDSLIMNTVLRCLEYSHRNAFMCYLRRLISTLQKMGGGGKCGWSMFGSRHGCGIKLYHRFKDFQTRL